MKKKQLLTAMLAAVMLASTASCGGSSDDIQSSSADTSSGESSTKTCEENGCVWDAFTPYEETITFTKGLQKSTGNNMPEGDSFTDNDYTRYIKEAVNVQPEIAWEVDANNYDQKMALSISTGDIPDMMVVDRTIFKQLVENDLIWDMGEAYEKCISPYLKEVYDTFGDRLWREVTVDGKIMGIPGTQLEGQHNLLWIRKDWLDQLGLEVPTTMEELEEVARAFVENDMSGTGNTIGITATEDVYGDYNGQHGLYSIFNYFDAYPEQWIEVDGKAAYGSIQPEMKDALETLSRWYEEGILDQEFAVRKSTDREALIASGQCGIMFGPWWGYGGVPECVENNPEADWAVVPAPQDAEGNFKVYAQDPVNGIMVVSKDFEHPEALIKAINAHNELRTGGRGEEAYQELLETSPNMMWSVTAVPLQIGREDSLAYGYAELQKALEAEDRSLCTIAGNDRIYDTIMKERENPRADVWNWQEAFIRTDGTEAAIYEKNLTHPVVFYGTTETMSTKWANLEKEETETLVKIITGSESVDYFDEFVANWKNMGGDQITEEVQAEVDAMG